MTVKFRDGVKLPTTPDTDGNDGYIMEYDEQQSNNIDAHRAVTRLPLPLPLRTARTQVDDRQKVGIFFYLVSLSRLPSTLVFLEITSHVLNNNFSS